MQIAKTLPILYKLLKFKPAQKLYRVLGEGRWNMKDQKGSPNAWEPVTSTRFRAKLEKKSTPKLALVMHQYFRQRVPA